MGGARKLKRRALALIVVVPVIVFAALSAVNVSAICDWTLEDVFSTSGIYTSFDSTLDPNGNIHIAYIGESTGFFGLHHAVQSGNGWDITRVAVANIYDSGPSIAIDPLGHVYISWTEETDRFSDQPSALGFATDRNGVWEVEMMTWEHNLGRSVIELDQDSVPHVMVSDYWFETISNSTESYQRSSVTHMSLGEEGWEDEVVRQLGANVRTYHTVYAMDIAVDGTIHAVIGENVRDLSGANHVTYLNDTWSSGDGWMTANIDSSTDYILWGASVAVDGDGSVKIPYYDYDDTTSTYLMNLATVQGDTIDTTHLGTAGNVEGPHASSICLGTDGTLDVAYYATNFSQADSTYNQTLVYFTDEGDEWSSTEIECSDGLSVIAAGVSIHNKGGPLIVYARAESTEPHSDGYYITLATVTDKGDATISAVVTAGMATLPVAAVAAAIIALVMMGSATIRAQEKWRRKKDVEYLQKSLPDELKRP